MRTGYSQLPLHGGKAPRWLFVKMKQLAGEIFRLLIEEDGSFGTLQRLSDPFWFQALGCVLGFDWHSSGLTTTTCGAIKEGLKGMEREMGFYAAGGKGATARKTPQEIQLHCEQTGYNADRLIRASRLSAKVDSSAIQDGYQIYHHAFFFTADGNWCVVQQGMNNDNGMARRYHWLGNEDADFVDEPHTAICCDHRGRALNFTARESKLARCRVTEIAARPETEVTHIIDRQELIMPGRHQIRTEDINPAYLHKILLKTYAAEPENFTELLGVQGVGAKTLRALALTAELLYGTRTSIRDPARFSFAHGGKDGTPFPVDLETYNQTIDVLRRTVAKSKVDLSDKTRALKRLDRYVTQKDPVLFSR